MVPGRVAMWRPACGRSRGLSGSNWQDLDSPLQTRRRSVRQSVCLADLHDAPGTRVRLGISASLAGSGFARRRRTQRQSVVSTECGRRSTPCMRARVPGASCVDGSDAPMKQ